MNAQQQAELGRRLDEAFKAAGVSVQEPDRAALPNLRYRQVEGDDWLKLAAYLARSGYRLILEDDSITNMEPSTPNTGPQLVE